MPSARMLSTVATIERDSGSAPDSVGDMAPGWVTIGTARPCAPAQPMTDEFRRLVGGDALKASYWTCFDASETVAKGDRVTIDGVQYRAEALAPWTSGTQRARHVEVALGVL